MVKSKNMDIEIEGMHCASCAVNIEKELSEVKGIRKSGKLRNH